MRLPARFKPNFQKPSTFPSPAEGERDNDIIRRTRSTSGQFAVTCLRTVSHGVKLGVILCSEQRREETFRGKYLRFGAHLTQHCQNASESETLREVFVK
ncbi:hypothetical protein Q7C36_021203 [Tachysurus vachellii]|uniref:Uncharacterized protein n=1 Tax=Tachysurus vachellii TaxID=175792 RepID=A0AA88LKA5_TACVA|nr:hypothetical protein Q7C36_021203 [Tachysurus vachellii]